MKWIKVKYAGIIFSIAYILFNHSLHLHHSEEIKDVQYTRVTKLFQHYYGPAIGADWL
jgi:hypothetical protein